MATLEQVLAERERRDGRQRELAQQGARLVQLTLNIPGPDKRSALADRAFDDAVQLLSTQPGIKLIERHANDAGCCAFFRSDMESLALKRALCAVEQNHPLGRLLDIDVLDDRGRKVSRADIGLTGRTCLICELDAHACARSRAHPLLQLQARTSAILRGYFGARLCDQVQQAATRALLFELAVTPKPGLVDRNNSGAHADMDYFTFLKSAAALGRSFYAMCDLGLHTADERALFFALQAVGREAEHAMYRATGGVNTHMGAIYTLGLLAGARGLMDVLGEAINPHVLLSRAASLARVAKDGPIETYSGARAEAMGGFPSIRNVALPALSRWQDAGENGAGVAALLHLIASTPDTNLIARSDAQTAANTRQEVKAALDEARTMPEILDLAARLDERFIRQNLSPGGCADLLAAAFMVKTLCDKEPTKDVD